ncbi:hypothetical protein BASA81_007980 [Batrachochytrium salamandrivorans]|nr:hypothetical protein BASA81_007980 [Batrachochytrium salamandrivorans]
MPCQSDNKNCTCADCKCGAGCQCGKPKTFAAVVTSGDVSCGCKSGSKCTCQPGQCQCSSCGCDKSASCCSSQLKLAPTTIRVLSLVLAFSTLALLAVRTRAPVVAGPPQTTSAPPV